MKHLHVLATKLSHSIVKSTVSTELSRNDDHYRWLMRTLFTDCGNEITRDEYAVDKVKTWPTTALAINENSSSRCTATIRKTIFN